MQCQVSNIWEVYLSPSNRLQYKMKIPLQSDYIFVIYLVCTICMMRCLHIIVTLACRIMDDVSAQQRPNSVMPEVCHNKEMSRILQKTNPALSHNYVWNAE